MKKNILIIRYSALGDLVTFEPMFRLVKNSFLDSNIVFLTSKMGEELYKNVNYFDEIITLSRAKEQINALKNRKFEVIFNLQCTKKSHFVTLFLDKKIVINRNSNLLQKLFGIKKKPKSFEQMLIESGVQKDMIENFKAQNLFLTNLPAEKIEIFENQKDLKIVAISTGSSKKWISKRWGVENYNALVKRLIKEGQKVVLVGDKLEVKNGEFIEKENCLHVKNLIDKTDLSELKNILKSADLFVGNDSGPAHIAAAVGTNTVTIFGSTGTKHCVKNFNYQGNHTCIAPKNLNCSPCYKSICPKKRESHMECMKSIKVDEVFEEIIKSLRLKNG